MAREYCADKRRTASGLCPVNLIRLICVNAKFRNS